jgi:hypothetical protein
MAHFAELNAANTVLRVIVIANDEIIDDAGNESEAIGIAFCQSLYGAETIWRQTSYHANFRCNYAGAGFRYDTDLDAFIAPQPFPSWTLNANCQWEAPVPMPADNNPYVWNEGLLRWVGL